MKKFCCLLLAVLLLISASSCQNSEPEHPVQINPTSGSENRKESYVSLYFGDASYSMLAREVRNIRVSVDSNVEKAVLEELLVGPEATISMTQIINPDTEVIQVVQEGRVLTVVLSMEFLDWSFIEHDRSMEEMNLIKQLAVYSIVNTLVEATGCPQVQLQVDREADGTGQRINLSEVGMQGNGVLEPLGRNASVVLSAHNTLEILLQSLVDRNYEAAYDLLAFEDGSSERPSEGAFVAWCQDNGITLESYSITETLEQSTQEEVIVKVDYTLKQSINQRSYTAHPVQLVQENSLWKIRFSELEKLLEY